MLINITTKFDIDPIKPEGRKNLNLLLTAAGIRSQIEMRSLKLENKNWQLCLFLERPEFWGDDLKFLKDDLESLIVIHKGKAVAAGKLINLEAIQINNS